MVPRSCVVVLAVLAALLTAGPASAAPRADALAFTKATLAFDLSRGKAIGRAERTADQRRAAAASCVGTLDGAPAAARRNQRAAYETHVGAGYFAEEAPIAARWVRGLRRVTTRDAALRDTRSILARQLAMTRDRYRLSDDFCGPAAAWAQTGWTRASAPLAFVRARNLLAAPRESSTRRRGTSSVTKAARILRSDGGTGGALAASVLRAGVAAAPRATVLERGDPVIRALS